jgi:DNA modification methylase
LDNGIITKSTGGEPNNEPSKANVYGWSKCNTLHKSGKHHNDSGSFSRYFSLDTWFDKKLQELPQEQQKTFPFLIVPKPSKSEKNKYIENKHPTVKPLKLMSYLITMGSREGDVILDPFAGSGTTLEAARLLNRQFVGIDKDEANKPLMEARGQLQKTTLEEYYQVVV